MLLEPNPKRLGLLCIAICLLLLFGSLFHYRSPSSESVPTIPTFDTSLDQTEVQDASESFQTEEERIAAGVAALTPDELHTYEWASYACMAHPLLPELPSESDTVFRSVLQPNARFTIVQLCTHPNEKIQPFLATHEDYARRHGYNYIVRKQPRAKTEAQSQLNAYWDRQIVLQEILSDELAKPEADRTEWIFMAEADTIVMNPLITLESILPPGAVRQDVEFIVGRDGWGINPGVFLIRASQWSWDLVFNIIYTGLTIPSSILPLHDQSALQLMFPIDKAVVIDRTLFNAWGVENPFEASLRNGEGSPGSFIAHFSGTYKPFLVKYAEYIKAANFSSYWAEGKAYSEERFHNVWASQPSYLRSPE